MKPVWIGQKHRYSVDDTFLAVAKLARERSGMDEFRMFQLWHMVGESAKLPDGDILEVGCGYGGSSLVISASAKVHGLASQIYLIDTFSGLVKATESIDSHKDGDMRGPEQKEVTQFLSEQGLPGIRIIQGVFPECCEVDGPFRFVHIDVDIYQSMKDAFEAVWPRMVSGGIVVLDDYGEANCPGVTKFIDESLPLKDACWFLHGALQAIAVKQ